MAKITRKGEVNAAVESSRLAYQASGLEKCIAELNRLILQNKVKFPLLEYCACSFFCQLPEKEHLEFCDRIAELNSVGGNVVIGIILQQMLPRQWLNFIRIL